MSSTVKVNAILTQGYAFWPIFNNSILEKVIKKTNGNDGIILGNFNINLLAYADDIAI